MRIGFALLFCVLSAPWTPPVQGQPLIPNPNSVRSGTGELAIPERISISSSDGEFARLIPGFTETAERYYGLKIAKAGTAGLIQLRRDRAGRDREGYRLMIEPKRIIVEAASSAGCFYGLQSVLQLLGNSSGSLRVATIEDHPRYEWRGLMLDEARHFFGVEEVKSILDIMALHKLNRFHWHLTDTSGWRIEIRKYPLLTRVGAVGNQTDPEAPARYYTQRQIREIVRYAQERFIEVIPEIDMPGHAAAAVRAYPELGGGGASGNPDFTFNPGKELVYQFLTDVLREVSGLFPAPFIHIGGDEVRLGNERWGELAEVQELMEREKLATLDEVEQLFLRRMAGVVRSFGKNVIVWDEALAAGLPADGTIVMWWRHNRPYLLQEALEKGYPVVMCPRIPMYFDFVQQEAHTHGRKWDETYVPIESVYRFPAPQFMPDVAIDSPLIQGIQANVWTDTMHSAERLQFMLYPRLFALAEAAWTDGHSKEWNRFEKALAPALDLLERRGIAPGGTGREEVPGPRR